MKASAYGIKNLQRILPNLIEWSRKGESYSELDEMYSALTGQFRRYMGHVTKKMVVFMTLLKPMTWKVINL
jgi:hypothetical protein